MSQNSGAITEEPDKIKKIQVTKGLSQILQDKTVPISDMDKSPVRRA